MSRRRALLVLLTAALLAAGAPPAAAREGAVCTVEARAWVEGPSRLVTGDSGRATCLGTLGGSRLDPLPMPAAVGGVVRRGARSTELIQGWVRLRPFRMVDFGSRREVRFDGQWTAASLGPVGVLSGEGRAQGRRARLAGESRLVAGTLRMTLVLG